MSPPQHQLSFFDLHQLDQEPHTQQTAPQPLSLLLPESGLYRRGHAHSQSDRIIHAMPTSSVVSSTTCAALCELLKQATATSFLCLGSSNAGSITAPPYLILVLELWSLEGVSSWGPLTELRGAERSTLAVRDLIRIGSPLVTGAIDVHTLNRWDICSRGLLLASSRIDLHGQQWPGSANHWARMICMHGTVGPGSASASVSQRGPLCPTSRFLGTMPHRPSRCGL
jgi:hypothetical protein